MPNTTNTLHYKHIAQYLNSGPKAGQLFSYAGLTVGILLLLCCVQMYININTLLHEKNPRKQGFDFISVTKSITNENMGGDNRFSEADIADFKKQPFVTDAAPLLSNQFRAKASAGDIIPFSTDLFLEAIQDNFIDTLPPSFTWQQGQPQIPIIFSADFLEMYNVFAPAQGLPQLSPASIGAVNITLEIIDPTGSSQFFKANIVAISDRINSVLVPKSFLDWGNKMYGNQQLQKPARLYLKTEDANSVPLQNYLQQKAYHVNKDKTKFGRIKATLQAVVAGLAGLAILVVLLSILLFSFYLQLMLSRSKNNLQLLLTLGYSPKWLSRTMAQKWLPAYACIITIALLGTQLFQTIFQRTFTLGQAQLSPYVHVSVVAIAIALFIGCGIASYSLIKKQLVHL